VFVIYGLLIFEGAIRKWVLPEAGQALFFIRVPFTLLLYWLAFYYRRWPRTVPPLFFVYIVMAASIFLLPVQFFVGEYSERHIMLAAYGWIMYFFYIPLAFLIGEQFRREDLDQIIRFTLWLAVAAAPLVLLQFFAPKDSVLNLGSGLSEDTQFKNLGAALGYVRPTGFFTATKGQVLFVASAAAFVVVSLIQSWRLRATGPRLVWTSAIAVFAMLAVSGSRGMFASVAVILGATAFAGLLTGQRSIAFKAGVIPFLLVVAAAILWPIFLPEGFEVFMARWQGAWESETHVFEYGFFGRVLWGFYAFVFHLSDTPIQGYLLGIGGNAAQQLSWVQLPPAFYAWQGYGGWSEDSWSRHIIDLGILMGIVTILGRIALSAWLALTTLRATLQTGDVLPFALCGFIFLQILYGQIQGQGTLNGYVWIFLGFCLAAAKTATGRTGPGAPSG